MLLGLTTLFNFTSAVKTTQDNSYESYSLPPHDLLQAKRFFPAVGWVKGSVQGSAPGLQA